jgi:hypothetical protein
MSITRQNVVSGPGSVTLNTLQMFDDGEITAGFDIESFDIRSSAHGKLGENLRDVQGKINFKPCGVVTQTILDALLPHKNPVIGASLFGAADVPAIVHGTDGVKLTLLAAALTKPPTLKLSASETLFSSDAEFTALAEEQSKRLVAAHERFSALMDKPIAVFVFHSGVSEKQRHVCRAVRFGHALCCRP